MKKWLAAGLLVGLSVAVVGCGNAAGTGANKQVSPKEITQEYFTDLQKGDLEQARALSEDPSFGGRMTEKDAKDPGMKQAKNITSHMKADVGAEQVNGDNATVDVKLTALDMTKIMGDTVRGLIGDALSSALTDQKGQDDSDKKAEAHLEQAIQDPNAPTVTSDIQVKLVQTKDGWRVSKDNGQLVQAMFGNPLK